jgi:hypothetical protein
MKLHIYLKCTGPALDMASGLRMRRSVAISSGAVAAVALWEGGRVTH